MIDTLILRLHDTVKYQNLIKNLDILENKGYQTETGKVEKGDVSKLRSQGIRKSTEIVDMLKLNRTGEFIVKTKVAKQQNASNHYSFAYFINYTANFIEFNFSVPKYTFGSNVLMLVDHYSDPNYSYHYCSQLEHNIERSFDLLSRFLHQFFKMEFPFSTVDYQDVEVHRIDVCFNQVFSDKKEALRVLEYQKRLKKKYAREEEGVLREYATSLMYVTKRYSAKIYHKGSEYAKNDLKEHLKINKEKGYQYFDTKQYQHFSDRILRYELTIRNGMLNYLHKKHLFRRKCSFYQMYYKDYMKVESSKQKNDRIAKKIGTLEGEEREAYKKAHPYDKIPKESRRVHKYVSNLITKRTYFTLSVTEGVKLYNKRTVDYDCQAALFSKGLLKQCLKKLMEFIGEFQIKELPEEEKVQKLIEHYKSQHRKPLPVNEMIWFYKKLVEIGSFKETARFYHLHRATLYRYKQRFKKIGITENNIRPLTEEGIREAPLDLAAYHYELTYNPCFLKASNLLLM